MLKINGGDLAQISLWKFAAFSLSDPNPGMQAKGRKRTNLSFGIL